MVAQVPTATGVRDSKLGAASPILAFSTDAWFALLRGVKAGKHNLG